MAQFFVIHPTHPQKRLIRQAADIVRRGGVIAYPTDSCYALGCDRGNTKGLERLRRGVQRLLVFAGGRGWKSESLHTRIAALVESGASPLAFQCSKIYLKLSKRRFES